MSDRTAEILAEQKRLAEAATEGWRVFITSQSEDGRGVENDDDEMVFWEAGGGITVARPHDAEFIAAARTSVPRMIAALEAVMALYDALPKWAEPDNLPADEHDVGYHDGLAAAIRAIEAALGGEGDGKG